MPTAPDAIVALTEHYRRNQDVYKTSLNETEVRVQFVDPFFEALGWDIHNRQHYAETYKDVVHEYSLRKGTHTEAPDYCFRVGGVRKFFIEAKRPGVNISTDSAPAFQLRSYAWTSKLPISLLTNFGQLAVYDCRKAPAASDKPTTARIDLFEFHEYVKRWDEIYARFSKDAVYKGSFDRYAESTRSKKGTAEVDQAFLAEIEAWRKEISSNIALRNASLSQRDLNFAVQRTIDRIIFLRICEDRGIEKYGQLRDLQQGEHVYKRLLAIYKHADEKYNSGLFHFSEEKGRAEEPDAITTALTIDDARLKSIVKRLYYPESPYQFSHFPVDILGQVYEQFLGKVIRLTAGHQVKIESKPELLKAHGVYYTPTYIVDYIVKHAVEPFVFDKTPRQVSKLRVIDPACGSGSFLLGAYEFLLNWHRDFYLIKGTASDRKQFLYQTESGEWHLTTAQKKRILLNNIYGLDIDSQAVEVTKLSLLLRVLEGENEQTIGSNLRLFHERALPDLGNNIKCGNALIGNDFYDYERLAFVTEQDKYRVNAFDWRSGFPSVFNMGGFDAVVGNPPYGYMVPPAEQSYFDSHYHHQDYQKDLYLLFMEKYEQLLRIDGRLGIIVSNTWLQSITYKSIRKHLANTYDWVRVLLLPQKVFKQATVDTHVVIFKRRDMASKTRSGHVSIDVRRGGVIVESHTLSVSQI